MWTKKTIISCTLTFYIGFLLIDLYNALAGDEEVGEDESENEISQTTDDANEGEELETAKTYGDSVEMQVNAYYPPQPMYQQPQPQYYQPQPQYINPEPAYAPPTTTTSKPKKDKKKKTKKKVYVPVFVPEQEKKKSKSTYRHKTLRAPVVQLLGGLGRFYYDANTEHRCNTQE